MSNMVQIYQDLRYALDPLAFIRERLRFFPDPHQAAIITSPSNQIILNCPRQWGKSTMTAARAVFDAWHQPESLIIVLGPSGRQSGEFVRKVALFLRRLNIRPHGDGGDDISIVLPNGSRIVGLPCSEAKVRGFSGATMLVIDEASRVPDDLFAAMVPVLITTNGRLWLLSTPNGRRGFFFNHWQDAEFNPKWHRFRIPATECPRIRPAALERQRALISDSDFRQDFLCEFIDTEEILFPQDLITEAVNYEISPIFN